MTYTIDPQMLAVAVVALLLGLLIGLGVRAPLKRKAAVLQERNDGLSRERDAALADRERLALEVKARDAQIRPLADEVDKLRRDFAKAQKAALAGDTGAAVDDDRRVDLGNLRLLKGVGGKFAERLAAAGITGIDQIAGWSGADVAVMDTQMGDFAGRIAGDRLVEQAVLLTSGRYTEYETLFGKLGPA